MQLRTPLLIFSLLTLLVTSANATSDRDRDTMQARMNELLSEASSRDQASTAGQERGSFCTYCHGKTGISKKDWIPNLAGQSGEYILDQNLAYATGSREHQLMNELTASMTDQELINVSIYYATQEAEHIKLNIGADAMTSGGNFYKSRCASCHGEDGKGQQGYTWIAGQKPEYVRRALTRYRDQKEGRMDAEMVEVMNGISDQLIDDVAKYLTTLN